MAAAVASTATTAYASVSSITITKPSGLAVNDIMVAFIHKEDGSVDTCSLTGWTTIDSMDDSTTGDWAYTLYKVATSADVAASNFTFTLGETVVTGGAIVRVTGANYLNPINQHGYGSDGTNNTAQLFSGGAITPTVNGIILMGIFLDQATTLSGQFITTNNPTWSEVADFNGSAVSLSVAWAYRPELTNTGNYGGTSAGSARGIGTLIGIGNAPVVVTDTVTMVDQGQDYDITATYIDTVSTSDTVESTQNKWNNTDKNSSSWTNITKNG